MTLNNCRTFGLPLVPHTHTIVCLSIEESSSSLCIETYLAVLQAVLDSTSMIITSACRCLLVPLLRSREPKLPATSSGNNAGPSPRKQDSCHAASVGMEGAVQLGSYAIQRILWARRTANAPSTPGNAKSFKRQRSQKRLGRHGRHGCASRCLASNIVSFPSCGLSRYFGLEAGVVCRSPTIALQF